jgi:hypothetical protein
VSCGSPARSQAATIRSIAFTDAFVGQVRLDRALEGNWPLERGRELVIPEPVQVRIHARDASRRRSRIVAKGAVTVRPRRSADRDPVARRLMLMAHATAGAASRARSCRLSAGVALVRSARIGRDRRPPRSARRVVAGDQPQSPPARSAVVPATARWPPPSPRYAVEGAAAPDARERRAAVLVEPACSARRARRSSPGASTSRTPPPCKLRGARLRRDRRSHMRPRRSSRSSTSISRARADLPRHADQALPLLDGRTRRCGSPTAPPLEPVLLRRGRPGQDGAFAARRVAPADAAAGRRRAFSPPGDRSRVVWTSAHARRPGAAGRQIARSPPCSLSFGSPL